MNNKKWILIVALTYSTTSFAFFCPNNFNQINMGDSLDQVLQSCGKPLQQTATATEEKAPQQWDYYLPQPGGSFATQSQGTTKMTVTFDANGTAINITMNGLGVGSTPLCGGNTIHISDNMETVKRACGTPGFVNKQQSSAPPTTGTPDPQNQTVTLIYSGNPPVSLIFQGGKLVEKK
jgi:hypothetical protein